MTDTKANSPDWTHFQHQAQRCKALNLQQLFKANKNRAQQLSVTAAGLFCDYSKNLIDSEALEVLLELAKSSGLEQAIHRLVDGEEVNYTEQRPALHTLLRHHNAEKLTDKHAEVVATQQQMGQWVESIRAGKMLGYSGKVINQVVNIGIGGSDLGPAMVVESLKPYGHPDIGLHFVSNIDPSDLTNTLATLNPETTAFIVSSKSFTTLETLSNAKSAMAWLQQATSQPNAIAQHFIGITANTERAIQFGIDSSNIFPLWDWVGGRYSLWSATGLPIAIAIGMDNFLALGEGARNMDQHFSEADFSQNLPVILALLEVWYVNGWGCQSQAILPYDQNLKNFPTYLQQLTMESNGKSVDRQGDALKRNSSPVIWGAAGTNGQHSFYQLLHQGTQFIPVDFILPLTSHNPLSDQHQLLVANCVAQSRALLQGSPEPEQLNSTQEQLLAKHKKIVGNRPSTTICMQQLTPLSLGALIALYEHKVFASSVIWNINAFDQWGVELGKKIGQEVADDFAAGTYPSELDASTLMLMERYQQAKTDS